MAMELRVGMTKHVHLFEIRELLLIMFVMQTEKAITLRDVRFRRRGMLRDCSG